MLPQRIKIIWGAGDRIKGHWYLGLFGLYGRREGWREDGLAISIRGLLRWTVSLALIGYISAALVLFYFWDRNPYSQLTLADAFLYPMRRELIATKHGRAFINEGMDHFRARRVREAEMMLRLGLARVPDSKGARLALARLYRETGRRTGALDVLEQGLTEDYPEHQYLQPFFFFAVEAEDFPRVPRVCERYAPKLTGPGTGWELSWLRRQWFSALMAAGDYEAALNCAEAAGDGDEAMSRRMLALLAQGKARAACDLAGSWHARPKVDLKRVLPLEARAAREAGKTEEMRRLLADLRRLAPLEPAPRIYEVVQLALAGHATEAQRAFDDFVLRFGANPQAMSLLADGLLELGNQPLMERCVAAVMEHGLAPGLFQSRLVDVQIRNGSWEAAQATLKRLPPLEARAEPMTRFWREWTERLLEAALSPQEGPQRAFLEWMKGRTWPMPMFRRSVDALTRAGRLETARELTEVAQKMFPASAWARRRAAEFTQP